MVEIQGLPGFRDFYPEELAARSHIVRAWHDVARRFGFEEYDGPPLESLEIYTRKSGNEIVEQLYEFEDKGGRRVALRPEMTPTLARMVGVRAKALRKPIRWYSVPQLFRYERQQRGRLREHFQLNMDIVGETDVLADAELLAAAIEVVRTLGLGPTAVRARVSDRRLLAAIFRHLGVAEDDLEGVYHVVDKVDREPRDRLAGRLEKLGLEPKAVDGVFDVTQLKGIEAVETRFEQVEEISERMAELARYLRHLDDLGAADYVDVDLSVVRGLAYYTGIVFELWDAGRELRAICGGGRYDDLLENLAGVDVPALGFGMGDVVLTDLVVNHGLLPEYGRAIDCFVVTIGDEARSRALRTVVELRGAGLSVVYELRERRVSSQLKSADQLGARWAVIIGSDELASDEARLRDMASGDERSIGFDGLVTALTE